MTDTVDPFFFSLEAIESRSTLFTQVRIFMYYNFGVEQGCENRVEG